MVIRHDLDGREKGFFYVALYHKLDEYVREFIGTKVERTLWIFAHLRWEISIELFWLFTAVTNYLVDFDAVRLLPVKRVDLWVVLIGAILTLV